MNQEVRSTLEQLKAKLYPQTQPKEKQMETKRANPHHQPPAVPNIPTADLFKQMSVSKATAHCLSIKVTKPAAISKLTGKPIDQVYTALWAIRNKGKKAKAVVAKQEAKQTEGKDQKYITFLENRVQAWQNEARKQEHRIKELETALAKAIHAPRNVTGEVQEVMEEVKALRATVAYLESKLFGGK